MTDAERGGVSAFRYEPCAVCELAMLEPDVRLPVELDGRRLLLHAHRECLRWAGEAPHGYARETSREQLRRWQIEARIVERLQRGAVQAAVRNSRARSDAQRAAHAQEPRPRDARGFWQARHTAAPGGAAPAAI